MIKIGQVVATHGTDAEVKVYPLTNDPKRFEDLEYVYLEKPGGSEKLHIKSVRYHKNAILLKFEEIDDMDDAQDLKKLYLAIPEELLVPLSEDQYFIFQIIGLDVYEDEEYFGKIIDVIETGSNDVYVVKNEEKQILIPALKSIVKKINLEEKTMLVELPAGLLD